MRYNIFKILFIFLWVSPLIAQDYTPVNGVHQVDKTIYAFTNATIYVDAETTIENGTLLVQEGMVKEVGKVVVVPKNAVKIDLDGYAIYPSFIEPYSGQGIQKRKSRYKGPYPQINSLTDGPFYWNEAVHPETNAFEWIDQSALDKKKAQWMKDGISLVNSHQTDGILRGTSTLLTVGSQSNEDMIRSVVANFYSFSKGVSKQTYPSSQMGSIALIRQFFYDMQWYQSLPTHTTENESFKSALAHLNLPHIFAVSDHLEVLRVSKIAQEFNLPITVKGGGDEYKRVEEIKSTQTSLIIPVNFPKAYDVTDPFLARFVTLAQLKHWEMAPYNPYILEKNGITFSFTSDGLEKPNEYLKAIRKAVKHGLSKSMALKALTQNPAEMLKINDISGDLHKGKWANFLVVKGDLFESGDIYEHWIQGHQHILKDKDQIDIRGNYDFKIGEMVYETEIKGTAENPSGFVYSYLIQVDSLTAEAKMDTLKSKMSIDIEGYQLSLMFEVKDKKNKGVMKLNGSYYPSVGIMEGAAQLPNGQWTKWNGIKNKHFEDKKKSKTFKVDTSSVNHTYYPSMAFGFDTLPQTKTYFIKNATVWTNEEEGVIKNANVLIQDGKIKSVTKSGSIALPQGTIVIDGTGKHVTSGIIDEHSHIAISKGVNEGGQSNSAEVSIATVIRPNDINIYRQLAGGVTCSQLLHGSANPIGGQSAIIKLKWGYSAEDLLIKEADGFIKFALGENVKQSNWGDYNRIRFPQTRMGVEQVFYDAFTRAKAYKMEWDEYNQLSDKKKKTAIPPRRDLELEAVLEIVESKRFITCHSYVQSEINMLMHVADSMGFTVNTFTHILEGYKVADKMKAHGAGGATFADWWAYKYEVNEAIPYNAAILSKMGVVTAINSDDAEMGRRLNQEAAKVVKYGGVTEQEAWKMVTLNPAKLLHLDDRMGSLKAGKDADVLIWSNNPLSIDAKVEQTFIDGILFYDFRNSEALYKRDQKERNRIIGLMIQAKNRGEATQKPNITSEKLYHCDTMVEE